MIPNTRGLLYGTVQPGPSKKESRWTAGLTWGLQLHVASYPGELLTIKQVIKPVQVYSPNLVKTAPGHKTTTSGPDSLRSNSTSSTPGTGGNLTNTPGHLTVTASSVTQDPLWAIVNAAFMALNHLTQMRPNPAGSVITSAPPCMRP